MPLVKGIRKQGNSAGIILDQPILKQVGWDVGTEVEVRVQGESVVLTLHRYATDAEVAGSADRMVTRHRKSFERLAK